MLSISSKSGHKKSDLVRLALNEEQNRSGEECIDNLMIRKTLSNYLATRKMLYHGKVQRIIQTYINKQICTGVQWFKEAFKKADRY